ncbi:MAG: hypothetical protein A3G40_14050 [Deltaproteobacteria bacterium RIFCSPLOWO2_12_FULL_57_22]|nr:MAG: hypothetical protein A3G40_14050 [Deltaproteobacteria bacterium RIFCSPLOWO2_12_FULL_57_22]
MNGFVGEFLILLGAFKTFPFGAAVAATGVFLGAIYMLWMFRRVVFGPLDRPENQRLKDVDLREMALLAPILALIFFMGVYPKPFLSRMKASVELVIQRVESKQEALPLVLEGRNNGVTRADGSTNSPYFEATMSLSNGN